MREHGIRVRLSDEIDAAAALPLVDLFDRSEVRTGLRIALKVPHEAWAVFDRLFDEHWGGAPEVPVPPTSNPGERRGALRWRWDGTRVRLEAQSEQPSGGDVPGYSPEQLLRRKPFDRISETEVKDIERLLTHLARRLATRRSRRLVPTSRRGLVDLRRSFRSALGSYGEVLRLARRARALEEPRIAMLFDTSGSMDPHTRFHLAFAFALRRAIRRVEVFAFNTTLTRVSRDIAPGRILRSLEELAASVPDWSGGTQIGQCLAHFVSAYDGLLGRDTTIIIVSDGLDLGDTAPLAASMRTLHERARRVIWLNPLLHDPRYEPTAAGMCAALPYVDHFAPGHDLESLERLARLMN
jgi:uncharacterized protein with von Willebrand factor type A (vWA) domain